MTPKQKAFCLAYAETSNGCEAYRRAYSAAAMKPETVAKRASELLASGEVTGMLANLWAAAAERAVMTLETHLADLKELRDAAARDGRWSAAIAAEIARGKHSGVAVEKTEATVKVSRALEDMTDEELAAEAARYGLTI